MIEKLPKNLIGGYGDLGDGINECADKINELIDAVNNLTEQETVDNFDKNPTNEKTYPQPPACGRTDCLHAEPHTHPSNIMF